MSDGEGSMSYVYDSYRRLTSETRQFTGLSGNSYSFNYSYNLSGQLLQASYAAPNFSKNINYRYLATGVLSSIGTNLVGSDPEATTNVIGSLSYRAFGAARQVNYGNDRKLELSYNADLMRLTYQKLTRANGSDKLLEYNYSYTENGLLSQVWDGMDSNYTRSYSYNARNQLTQSTGSVTTNYNYDDWGNLTWINENGSAKWFNYAKLSNSNTPATNRLSEIRVNSNSTVQTSFSWDAAGNMTAANSTTYEWDAANRLKSVNGGSLGSYGYDGNGKRVKKTEGGNTIYYVYSSVVEWPLMEVSASGVYRAYVMNGASVIAEQSYDGNFYWVHKDHLGSGRKLTNTSGTMVYRAEYDPYGKLLYEWSSSNQPNLNSKKFTGYERDSATGLDYAEARMYASEWGRFMSPDPIGLEAADLTRPQSLNRYSYVENDPINFNDPEGLVKCGELTYRDGVFQGWTVSQIMNSSQWHALMAQLVFHEAGTIFESDKSNIAEYYTDLTGIATAILNQYEVDNNIITVYNNGRKECPLPGGCRNRWITDIIYEIAQDKNGYFWTGGVMRPSSRKWIDDVLNTDIKAPPLIKDQNGDYYNQGCEGMISSINVVGQILQGYRQRYRPNGLILLFWNQASADSKTTFPGSEGYIGVAKVREQGHTFWGLSTTPPPPSSPRATPGGSRPSTGRRGASSRGAI